MFKDIDLRPLEEETCYRNVIKCYENIKRYNWIIVILKEIGRYEDLYPETITYCNRITYIIDEFLENNCGLGSTLIHVK